MYFMTAVPQCTFFDRRIPVYPDAGEQGTWRCPPAWINDEEADHVHS